MSLTIRVWQDWMGTNQVFRSLELQQEHLLDLVYTPLRTLWHGQLGRAESGCKWSLARLVETKGSTQMYMHYVRPLAAWWSGRKNGVESPEERRVIGRDQPRRRWRGLPAELSLKID